MRAHLAGATMVAIVLVAAAGCGGGSSSKNTTTSSSKHPATTASTAQFKAQFVAIADQFGRDSRATGAALQKASSKTDAQLGQQFSTLASRWQNHLSRLQTLKPPSDLAVPFNTVSSAVSRVEADLNAIVAAARTHSGSAAKQATVGLIGDITAAKAAATTITNKLGVK